MSYTLAGFETLPNYFRKQDILSAEDVNKFFHMNRVRFLRSYGQNFKDNLDTHVSSEVKTLVNSQIDGIYKGCMLIIDSGGFQIATNRVSIIYVPDFMSSYYDDFLINHHHLFSRAFVMDIPPGPGCEVFGSFDDVYRLNAESYLKASNLPQHIKDKMVYIHHFRTPQLWKIFLKILRDNDYFDEYQYHGTGGLVASMSSDVQIPCIMSMLPMVPLLNDAIRFGRKEMDFHVLGGSTMRDVFFYKIFELHIEKVHGIKVNIAYDSSGLYKGVMMGRTIPILHDVAVHKLDLREAKLDLRFSGATSIRDKFGQIMLGMCDDLNFIKPPTQELNEIYYNQIETRKDGTVKETRTFIPNIRMYIALYYLYSYTKAEDEFAKVAERVYPIYESGDIGTFNQELEKITRGINFGKITRKQLAKTYSLSRTLDMLTSLDEDYCEHLVIKYLGKDEFDLDPDRQFHIF